MIDWAENNIVLDSASRAWRRRLGPLAWAVLEELAFMAHPTEHGWAAPVGVRDVGAGLGVTKDTAARAITTLRAAGLVTWTRIQGRNGGRRPGYHLHLPQGLTLQSCPTNQDTSSLTDWTASCRQGEDKPCPGGEDSNESCHACRDTPPAAGPAPTRGHNGRRPVTRTAPRKAVRAAPEAAVQPTLFGPPPLGDASP